MAALDGKSTTPLFRDYRSQEPRVPQERQKAKPLPGPLGSLLYSISIYHNLSIESEEYQGGLLLPYSRSWRALHSRTHSSSSHPREPHPVSPGRTDPCRHSKWACSARRPRRENLCPHLLAIHPSGLPSCFPGLWTPRQPAYSLAPPSSLLVAQYGPGYLPICPRMLSLCHLQISSSPPRRKFGTPTNPPSSVVLCRSQLYHISSQLRCGGSII